ncbi:MAG: hypothetical protein R3E10_08870 [Gemmatimonadota bacterium]
MVPLLSLWLPILLSAVITFVVSAIIWMALPHHKTDYVRLPDEDALMGALRAQNLSRGVYLFPFASGGADMKDPAYLDRVAKGPVGLLRVLSPAGMVPMGKQLVSSFLLYVFIGVLAAYLASRTLPAGADYLMVFRVTGTVVWISHSIAHFHDVIWFGQKWSTGFKLAADGLVYALLAGGVFGWLWPAA